MSALSSRRPRRAELLSLSLFLGLLACCSGHSTSKPGDDGGVVLAPQAAPCVEAQRKWVQERAPADRRQGVEATIRAVLQDPDELTSMPTCSGQ